ncbi:Alpha/beta hydrolase fold-1 [Cyathus striatus]|nr:Alpha/beta hydrolase fold-1 [Cyathus striatus]
MLSMLEERITLPADPLSYPFHITAKRYYSPSFPDESAPADSGALTLVVLHSTSFHKETWEPSLAHLFKLASDLDSGRRSSPSKGPSGNRPFFKIREAWAVECPNHGESGSMNDDLLRGEYVDHFSCQRYAEAVHRFLTAGPYLGAKVDFRKRKLLGIGHSLGANAMILLQRLKPLIPFHSIIIVEPLISPGGTNLEDLRIRLVRAAKRRVGRWDTREEAGKELKVTSATKWDGRVLSAFVKHAIRSYPDRGTGVFLACSKEQEVTMYNDAEGPLKPVGVLRKLCDCNDIPVHLIVGEKDDFIPKHVQKAIRNLGKYTTGKVMSDVGHLIPQEKPEELATEIYKIISLCLRPVGGGGGKPPLNKL